jgi:hypothetical protein
MRHLKSSTIVLIFGALFFTGTAEAGTDVSVSFSSGHRHHPRHHYRPHPHVAYYAPHRYPRYHRYGGHPYRSVVVVPQPVYVNQPVPAPPLSGNYGQDLADFRERLNLLRAIVQKQKDSGVLALDAHDRFMSALDGIERDQQARSYNRGGTMHLDDFAELYRRLDETDADIERALAG